MKGVVRELMLRQAGREHTSKRASELRDGERGETGETFFFGLSAEQETSFVALPPPLDIK